MKKRAFIPFLLILAALVMFGWSSFIGAQQAATNRPPAIILFSADLSDATIARETPLTVDVVESAELSLSLSWHVIHGTVDYSLRIEQYFISDWVAIPNTPWPFVSDYALILTHPLNFGPPTFRLSLLDANNNVLESRIAIVNYAIPEGTRPVIELFTTDVEGVSTTGLAQQGARVPVSWRVTGRVPTSNLIFEQVLPDGNVISIELPRPTLWIASSGEGIVAPVSPQGADSVLLRLRVVDVITGEVYDETELDIAVIPAP